jgi:citrate lyase alpha subunit
VFVPGAAVNGAPGVVVTTGAEGREGEVDVVCAEAAVIISPLVRARVSIFTGKNLLLSKGSRLQWRFLKTRRCCCLM